MESRTNDGAVFAHELRHALQFQKKFLEFLSFFLPFEKIPYASEPACQEGAAKAFATVKGLNFDLEAGQPEIDSYIWYFFANL